MKKVLLWLMVMSLIMTMVVMPTSVFAEDVAEGTEPEAGEVSESKQIVHFNYNFEDYSSSGTLSFPNSKTAGVNGGSWGTLMSSAGNIIEGIDGNAFHISSASGYATYKPTSKWTSGKILVSADISYDPLAPEDRQTWVMTNVFTKDDGTTDSEYIWIAGLEAGSGKGPCMYGISASSSSANTKLFESKSADEVYSVDIVIDLEAKTRTWYVNGQQKYSNKMNYAGMNSYTPGISQIKFNMTKNVAGIDNFKIIENPDAKFSFSQNGEVTTESEYITVRFSDTVYLTDTTDFVIVDENGETAATVAEIQQVNGKFYNLKLSEKLEAGTYNLKLNDETLTSVIAGTTSSNTTSEFTVDLERTFFDIDFENYTTSEAASTYYNTFNQYGSFSLANSNDQTKSNTYGFAGDEGYGITCSSSGTRNLCFTPSKPITSGKVVISYDAAFDATRQTSRQQMLYVEDATNGCILTYGISGKVTVIAGAKASGHYSGGSTKAYVNNQAYRWDTVIDMDAKTVTNYCDGVQFNKVTYTTSYLTDGDIKNIYLRFKPAITFFDNYKMTVNVNEFGYTATDIPTDSNSTTINFDDTMVLGDTDLIFKDPEGNAVTPLSITKISPRKYKVAFAELFEGAYTVSLADGKKSAIGNVSNTESVTFNVAERPIPDLTASSIEFSDVEGGVKLNATISNTTENLRKAFLIIGVFKDRVLEECIADVFEISAGEENVEKTVILTTDLDLSQYTVRGFVWDREDISPLIGSITR